MNGNRQGSAPRGAEKGSGRRADKGGGSRYVWQARQAGASTPMEADSTPPAVTHEHAQEGRKGTGSSSHSAANAEGPGIKERTWPQFSGPDGAKSSWDTRVEKAMKQSTTWIRDLGRRQEWAQALWVLSDLRVRGLEPNVITYSALVSACTKGSKWQMALNLMSEMKDAGLKPDVVSCNAAISACEKGGKWQEALSFLGEMKELGLKPNTITFNSAITACASNGQVQQALALFDTMEEVEVEPNSSTFTALANISEGPGDWRKALGLLDEMRSIAARPPRLSGAQGSSHRASEGPTGPSLLHQRLRLNAEHPETRVSSWHLQPHAGGQASSSRRPLDYTGGGHGHRVEGPQTLPHRPPYPIPMDAGRARPALDLGVPAMGMGIPFPVHGQGAAQVPPMVPLDWGSEDDQGTVRMHFSF